MTKRSLDKETKPSKRQQSTTPAPSSFETPESCFQPKLWTNKFQQDLSLEIKQSKPYQWGTIKELMNDDLLRQVRKEILSQIHFTEKETDIYKVFQSGDLANLSGLDWDDLSRLPYLFQLRNAIYSQEFRDVISTVTGCGKLSGSKTDMSINTYTKGCHLLTHDDVIGSRRVSFILYLPDPDRIWKEQYGGGLRLYPSIVPNVPHTDHHAKLVPQFNQIAFFNVQPGLSFHDVEEVREDKQRLSIQGWFHIPQKGEDGYIEGEQQETEAKSTLQQLQSKQLQEFDFPKPIRLQFPQEEIKSLTTPSTTLFQQDIEYLSKYINVKYLSTPNLFQLRRLFLNESIIELSDFLQPKYSDVLSTIIRDFELNSPSPTKSTDIAHPWKCAIPPHKHRFMYIDGTSSFPITQSAIEFRNNIGPQEYPNFSLVPTSNEVDAKLVEIANLFKSMSFKKWLKTLTSFVTTSDQILIRRFRPGIDFTLGTTIPNDVTLTPKDENVLLEATLNITPSAANPKNWKDVGGYELCVETTTTTKDEDEEEDAPEKAEKEVEEEEDDDDDPAIYKAGSADSLLYGGPCRFNVLTLMLRDSSVLKFIKYVSINAKGSRWDLSCQWNVREENENDEKVLKDNDNDGNDKNDEEKNGEEED